MAGELDAILGYIEELRQLDTSGVEPMTHAVPFACPQRPDEVGAMLPPDEALANAPAPRRQLLPGPADRSRPRRWASERAGAARGHHRHAGRRACGRGAGGPATWSRATWIASLASTASWAASCGSTPPARAPPPTPSTPASPLARTPVRWRGCPSALKDIFATRGLETTAGSKILRRLRAPLRQHRRRPAAGRRGHQPGQAEHGRVRHGLVQREQRLQAGAQPLGARSRAGRLVGRVGGGGGRLACAPARWAPTPAVRSASRRRCVASPGSSRPTGASRATG